MLTARSISQKARGQNSEAEDREQNPASLPLVSGRGFRLPSFLHNAGAAARHELGAERIGILPADRPDPSRILHPGAHVQVALLDEDRVVADENVGVVLLYVVEFLNRLFLGESRRNLDSPRLRLRGRAAACAAWRLHAWGKRPFLLYGRTAEGRSAASIRHSPSRNPFLMGRSMERLRRGIKR